MNIKQLEERKNELLIRADIITQKIEALIKKETSKDFIEVKNFRIYKWDKPVKDFVYPRGYRMADFQEFVDLYDSGFQLDKDAYYFVKHFSKLQQKKEYCLSRLYLNRLLYIGSNDDYLANSNDYGRVVVIKEKKS